MSISQKRLELQLSGLERLLLSTIPRDCHLYLCKRLKKKIQTCENFQEYSTVLFSFILHTLTVSTVLYCAVRTNTLDCGPLDCGPLDCGRGV